MSTCKCCNFDNKNLKRWALICGWAGMVFALLASEGRSSAAAPPGLPEQLLWYRQPARDWNEALPLGNGRLGAMVFGGIETERLQLNEDTFWSGRPHNYSVNGAAEVLPEVRRLLFGGKENEATQLASRLMGQPIFQQGYQPLPDLFG